MEFYNKAQIKRIAEFDEKADELGCLPVDAWTTGTGWRTKYRALPPCVIKFSRGEDAPAVVVEWFRRNPRRTRVLWIDRQWLGMQSNYN